MDLYRHFQKNGIVIQTRQPLVSDAVAAEKGVALKIAGRQIGIYKYNIKSKKQIKKLKKINEQGLVYIIGKKFPVVVNGSFVMIDWKKNKKAEEIKDAFVSFK